MPNDFLEKTLEDIIFENKAEIHKKGLPKFRSNTFRQFYLPSGKKIDIISFDLYQGTLWVDLYELKKDTVDTASICQAYNYLHEFTGLIHGGFNDCHINIIMIGKKYEPISLLNAMNINISVFVYDYGMNGPQFLKQEILIKEALPNDIFTQAMWAWGEGRLHYPEGQPSVVNIAKGYMNYLADKPDFDSEIRTIRNAAVKEIKLLPAPHTASDEPTRSWPWNTIISYDESAYDDNGPHYETNE